MKKRMLSVLLSVMLVIATICVSNMPSRAVEPDDEMTQDEMWTDSTLENSGTTTEELAEGTEATTEVLAEEGTEATTEELTEETTEDDEKDSENIASTETIVDENIDASEASETVDTDYAVSDAAIVTASDTATEVAIDETNFPDSNFRSYVKQFDTDGNGSFSSEELLAVTSISVSSKEIGSLKGVEYFTALEHLSCFSNQLTNLDVSNCTTLKTLYCSDNQLISLDVSNCTTLEILNCSNNQLISLDVSNCIALTGLYCRYNQLTSLDVSKNTALEDLDCTNNQLISLDVSNNTALEDLDCTNNQLISLDVSGDIALGYLECSNNQLTSLNVSKNTALWRLDCANNQLTNLDVSNNLALIRLWCSNNQLTSLDVSNTTALLVLDCCYNYLTSLNVSNCTVLSILCCTSNQLTSLDVSNNTALEELYDSNNPFNNYDVVIEIAPEIKLDDEAYDTLINSIFTELEIKSGKHLKVDLIVAMVSEANVGQSDLEAIKAVAKKRKIAVILDMNIVRFIDGIVSGTVNQLDKEIIMTIDVPKEFQAANRKFSIIRLHDGIAEELPDLDDNPNTVTFTTGKFSLYALIYEDVEGITMEPSKSDAPETTITPVKDVDKTQQAPSPNTGDSTPIAVVFILMLISAFFAVISVKHIKKNK